MYNMEKLFIEGYYPGAIATILSFLSPQTCVLKKNTDGTRIQCVSQKFNNTIPPVSKDNSKCSTGIILDKNRCRFHCKAFPIYSLLDRHIKRDKMGDYIHFDKKTHATFMRFHKPELISKTCCGGKGYQWKNRKKFTLGKTNCFQNDFELV
jgi:hypothetical protein